MCGDGAWAQAERIGAICRGTRRRGFQRFRTQSLTDRGVEQRKRVRLLIDPRVASRQLFFFREDSYGREREREEFLHPFDCFGLATLTRVLWPLRTFTVHRQEIDSRSKRQLGEVSAPLDMDCGDLCVTWETVKDSESHEFHDFQNIL